MSDTPNDEPADDTHLVWLEWVPRGAPGPVAYAAEAGATHVLSGAKIPGRAAPAGPETPRDALSERLAAKWRPGAKGRQKKPTEALEEPVSGRPKTSYKAEDALYVGMLRQMAVTVGWPRLRELVERLSQDGQR